jgi:hypothetical protein
VSYRAGGGMGSFQLYKNCTYLTGYMKLKNLGKFFPRSLESPR